MNHAKFDGQEPQNVVNAIKQKHFRDIDAEDYEYLKNHVGFLTEADKEIYLEGKDPKDVLVNTTSLTQEERLINENRVMQEQHRIVKDVRDEAIARENAIGAPKTGEEKTEAEEALAKERKEHVESLKEEVGGLEKEESVPEEVEKEKKVVDKKNK